MSLSCLTFEGSTKSPDLPKILEGPSILSRGAPRKLGGASVASAMTLADIRPSTMQTVVS